MKEKKGTEKTVIVENLLLAQRLKERREQLGLFQIDVAERLDVNSSVISNYEHAYRDPSTVMLNKIAKLYNVSVDYLLGNTNIVDPYPFEATLSLNERAVSSWYPETPEKREKNMRNFSSMLEQYVEENSENNKVQR